jgi:hypothetical protein
MLCVVDALYRCNYRGAAGGFRGGGGGGGAGLLINYTYNLH